MYEKNNIITENEMWVWYMMLNISNKDKLDLLNKYDQNIEDIYNIKRYLKEYSKKINDEIFDDEKKRLARKNYIFIMLNKIKIVKYIDNIYPEELRNIYDPPIAFLAMGNLNLLKEKKVAIVGARDAKSYGIHITKEIVKHLTKKDYIVVSGLAKGIDSISHLNVEDYRTIAVIGSGITKKAFYPKENYNLFLRIVNNGGLVITEYMPDESPQKWNFPMRNRIIAGLSDSIIVTQARKKSGSLITASLGLENGKDVFTIPSNIDMEAYRGNNELILDGAIPIICKEDLERYF